MQDVAGVQVVLDYPDRLGGNGRLGLVGGGPDMVGSVDSRPFQQFIGEGGIAGGGFARVDIEADSEALGIDSIEPGPLHR